MLFISPWKHNTLLIFSSFNKPLHGTPARWNTLRLYMAFLLQLRIPGVSPRHRWKRLVNFSTGCQNMNFRLLASKQSEASKIKGSIGSFFWQERSLFAGLFIGFLVCFCTPQPSYADALDGDKKKEGYCDASSKKKVLTDYSVIGIPGDGGCMFRSIAHGACLREGKPAPNETLQRELADELRARVADEFTKRRKETEWFIEGDFDTCFTNEEASCLGGRT